MARLPGRVCRVRWKSLSRTQAGVTTMRTIDRAAGTRHANGGAGICRAAVASSVAR
jgi:hypothetical protein